MSEMEKQQRYDYRRRRGIKITVQAAIIAILTVALIFTGFTYIKMNRETYVDYTQDGSVIYKAYLKDNAFYSEEYLNGSHAYVASLIEYMTADFSYKLKMDAEDVNYKYSYKIDAELRVTDTETDMAIYNPIYELKAPTTAELNDNELWITDSVKLDYNTYNKTAKDFIAAYNLKDTSATLIVRMYVDVLGESQTFAENNEDRYTIELFVPLAKPTVTPYTATTVVEEQQRVLAVSGDNKMFYKNLSVAFAITDAVAIIVLLIFAAVTRDKHIDYARRVQRLVSSYKSYIQKINNAFDKSDYQVLNVDTFTELLEIRDTLQIPILMYENEDKTCSEFFIVTKTDLLYLYKISVATDNAPNIDYEETVDEDIAAVLSEDK